MSMRIILIKDSVPLSGKPIEIPVLGLSTRTNADGIFAVDQPMTGDVTVRAYDGETWITTTLTPDTVSGLVVLDLTPKRTSDFNFGERFEVGKVLGRGGMGVVVEAVDSMLERKVAIKSLSDALRDNEQARKIFLSEGRALGKLKHPNLVEVYDVMAMDNRVFMILEYVEGDDLDKIVEQNGRFSQLEIANLGLQFLSALKYLHGQGVIHRDVKPSNMMLTTDGQIKIIDFGLARSLEALAEKGTSIRGTPAYMAPEQVKGEQLTYATDVYQFGVSLFELTTGRLPFERAAQGMAHVTQEVPSVQSVDGKVDREFAKLIDLCLRKIPTERPSVDDIVAGLQNVKSHLETNAPPRLAPPAIKTSVETQDFDDEAPSNVKNYIIAAILLCAVTALTVIVLNMLEKEETAFADATTVETIEAVNVANDIVAIPKIDGEPDADVTVVKALSKVSARIGSGVDAAKLASKDSEPETDVRPRTKSKPKRVKKVIAVVEEKPEPKPEPKEKVEEPKPEPKIFKPKKPPVEKKKVVKKEVKKVPVKVKVKTQPKEEKKPAPPVSF